MAAGPREVPGRSLQGAARWLADGSLRTEETVVDGIEHAPKAFPGMMRGANTGTMLVRPGRADG
ncbi:hypothetical protein ACFRJ1_27650 [Streptomyces sp. NPDC056773]|uniref:hypothetical protein n=1 Tax=unclassified Streptomyces TaxID=2593676 RepID=UPI0036B4B918